MSDMNIYQRINAVMKEVEYVKKDSVVQGYKAVTHDQVTAVLRKSMVKNGIVIRLEQLTSNLIEKRDLSRDIKMHHYNGDYAVHFVNMDNPDDMATVTINAHAQDNGDKAPGKAASYATKYAMLKMFSLETGENDESRAAPDYTNIQKAEFDEILEAKDAIRFVGFSQTVGNDIMMALNGSFEKGRISQGKALCKKLEKEGWDIIKDYAHQIKEGIKNEDPAVGQLVDELEPIEKKLVAGLLDQTEIEYLRSM